MTHDNPAISRPVPLLGRLREALAAAIRRRRAAYGGDPPYLMVHVHDRPRAFARTSVGTVPVILSGACLYDDALVFRMTLMAGQDMDLEAVTLRLGAEEMVVSGERPMSLKTGEQARFSWAATFDAIAVVKHDDEPTPPGGDDEPPAEVAS